MLIINEIMVILLSYLFIDVLIVLSVQLDEVLKVEKEFYDTLQAYWREHNFLKPKWWLLVILSILPALIWWKLVNRKFIIQITAFGLFYGVAAIILDSMGSNMLVWTYPIRLTPYLYPQLYPYDVGLVIIPFMLVYQRWGNHFKKFLFFGGILSLFLAFVAEPTMELLGIYQEFTWKNIYSFPIYWLLSVICWAIIHYFLKIQEQA
jgi:hypothetical protein